MHPLHTAMIAELVTQERLRDADHARLVAQVAPGNGLRFRLGTWMVRTGARWAPPPGEATSC